MSLLSRNPAGAGLTVAAAVATLCAIAPAGAAEIYYQPIVQLSTAYNTNLDLTPIASEKRSAEGYYADAATTVGIATPTTETTSAAARVVQLLSDAHRTATAWRRS